MPVTVTFRRVRPTDALRRYAETKTQRLQKFVHHPIDAHVILAVDKHRHIAELVVTADGINCTATEQTGDLYSAIDLAMAKIERQVARQTTKRKARKHDSGAPEESAVAPVRRTRTTRTRRRTAVIETERVTVKPMSVDEGVMEMNLLKKDFLLFKNAATEALSVVYRRRDGNYGLIEPEVP